MKVPGSTTQPVRRTHDAGDAVPGEEVGLLIGSEHETRKRLASSE